MKNIFKGLGLGLFALALVFTMGVGSANAALTFDATTVTGSSTLTLVGTTSSAVSLDSGTTGAVNLGTGASAKTITLGNVTGATGVVVNTGTGHFTVNTTTTGDIVFASADDFTFEAADDILLSPNSAAGILNLGTGNDGYAINVGTDNTAADTIVIGSALDTSSLAGIAVTVGSTGTTSALTLQSGTGDVNLTSTDDINIGANAVAQNIVIGNVTGATDVTVNVGTGNFAVNTTTSGDIVETTADDWTVAGVAASDYTIGAATTTGTITIGGTAGTGAMTFGSSTGVGQTVNIGSGNSTGADVLNLGTGTATTSKTVNIATGAISAVNIGTGNFVNTIKIGDHATPVNVITIGGAASSLALADAQWSVTSPGVATFVNALVSPSATLGLDTGSAGALSLGNVTATSTSICNSAACDTITIGTNADDDTITIGEATDTNVSIVDNNWSIGTGGAASFVTMAATTSATVGGGTAITKILAASLADDASGWVPDGAATDFTITANAASITATSHVTISVGSNATAAACGVYQKTASTDFRVKCSAAPANAATLQYMIVNF